MKSKQPKTKRPNPFQRGAVKNQSPHWLKDQGQAGNEEIPAPLLPHPFVDARLADAPPETEAAEGRSGKPDSGFEDEPVTK